VCAVTSDPHRNDDPIVELVRLPTRFEAELVADDLRAHGIDAMVAGGDADGWLPHLALYQGHRVMVFKSDLDRARERVDGGSPE
jgi:Putative prokaryotic signal transducing protein